MARSNRALARRSNAAILTDPAVVKANEGSTSVVDPVEALRRRAASLALVTADEVSRLRDVNQAYVCVERLISPVTILDHDEFRITHGELGALMAVLNAELQRRVEEVETRLLSLRKTLKPTSR